MSAKSMAEAIEDIAHRHQMGLFDIDVKNLAAALSDAGFGPVQAARAEALRQSAAIGWDAAVSAMTYEDGTPVEVAKNSNPYRTEVGDDASD